jgi:hypothetical protein
MFYRQGFDWIESLDTSNPIVHALLNIDYDHCGLVDKQSIKLVDMIHAVPDNEQLHLILVNTTLFKSYVRGSP